jgi:hypothetical protein
LADVKKFFLNEFSSISPHSLIYFMLILHRNITKTFGVL